MPVTRPSSDLRNKFTEISKMVHESGEPVFITRNGRDNMVVMSMAAFEQREAKLELMQKLLEAESEVRSGALLVSHGQPTTFPGAVDAWAFEVGGLNPATSERFSQTVAGFKVGWDALSQLLPGLNQ